MKRLAALFAVLALTGCTPEEIAAVEAHYRAQVEAVAPSETEAAPLPTWSVTADCGGAHVVLSGWTNVTDVSPSTGRPYAILGLGGSPPGVLPLDGGGTDVTARADVGTAGTAYGWSLIINGDPSLRVAGTADC